MIRRTLEEHSWQCEEILRTSIILNLVFLKGRLFYLIFCYGSCRFSSQLSLSTFNQMLYPKPCISPKECYYICLHPNLNH
ncbi:hypothetical protein HanPSC8_Chr01g0021171 [Helianthus annuus]|nr:hypothetical protein HanPSC8_Chr01g0021171 [Helianthus annuus]